LATGSVPQLIMQQLRPFEGDGVMKDNGVIVYECERYTWQHR